MAQVFGRTGHISLLGWDRTAVVGQFLVLGPLASSLVVQQLFVALLATICLAFVYVLLRPAVGPRRAAFGALLVALWPGFGLLATSFMTDVPALTLTLGSLVLGRRALARDSRLWFGLSLAMGLWAATIREQALAAPAALLLYALMSHRARRRVRVATVFTAAALFAAAFLILSVWYATLPNGDPPRLKVAPALLGAMTDLSVRSFFTLALPLAPAVLLVARPWNWNRRAVVVSGAMAVVGAMAIHDFGAKYFFLGNYLASGGAYAAVVPGARVVIPADLWGAVIALAALSGALLAGLIVQRPRAVEPVLATFTAITAIATVATGLSGQNIFDRYLLALAPAALAVILAPDAQNSALAEPLATIPARLTVTRLNVTRLNVIAAVTATASAALLAFALMANAFSFDVARWHAATETAATGVPRDRIDGGLEWLGYFSARGYKQVVLASGYGWEPHFSSSPYCFIVTAGRSEPGWTLKRRIEYRTFLIAGTSTLYLYSTHAACP